MGSRGPKSQNQNLNLVTMTEERPSPPAGLSKRAKNTWREIVDSLPPSYFRKGAIPLLKAYCQAEEVHHAACRSINTVGLFVETKDSVKANPAIAIQTAKANEMATLSTKLRLSVSAYRDRDAAGVDGREKPKSNRANSGLLLGGRDAQ
jgi:P27 family predicted phage terminase small subunit